ncbi:hypothetical protein [Gemmatimonas sp.]|jgi:hypothetical protein|uniref:hypothetical protein n=1 Tax=Gemmatimonas sp. TaxID=1962908 RepID=UPI0027B8BF37|nr:hypothetical protein [Gemmatimonas sp.]
MRPPDQSSDTAPLLALVNATAEWHAGLPGACSASVRLLDRVHFTVYRGDCVVVHHDDPASARVLLAALGGRDVPPMRRLLHAHRHSAPGVRIRRCSIPVDAVEALQSGWTRHAADGARAPDVAFPSEPVVHLLRASRHTVITRHERTQWAGWAHRVRATGGALVIVAAGTGRRVAAGAPAPRPESTGAGMLREPALATYPTADARSRIHALWLHHGRLGNARTWA